MKKPQLIVRRRSSRDRNGWLELGPYRWPCALGRGGIRIGKREGDGATPRGRFRLLFAYYRPDTEARVVSRLPLEPIDTNAGWCDAPSDANYNKPVRHPYRAGAERLWRDDRLYDLVVVLDYNIRPRIKGRGSAIFMHVAREGFAPTEGCIALKRSDLRRLLAVLPKQAHIIVP